MGRYVSRDIPLLPHHIQVTDLCSLQQTNSKTVQCHMGNQSEPLGGQYRKKFCALNLKDKNSDSRDCTIRVL